MNYSQQLCKVTSRSSSCPMFLILPGVLKSNPTRGEELSTSGRDLIHIRLERLEVLSLREITVGDRVVVTTLDPKPRKCRIWWKSMVFATGRAPAAPVSVPRPPAITFYYFYRLWKVCGPFWTSEKPDPSQNPVWRTRSGHGANTWI